MNMAGTVRARWLAFLLLAVVVSRIPLLFSCYSNDPDAWRVARVGKEFWQTGIYTASRFPGYPVNEIAEGLAVLAGGSFLSNTTTLALSLVLIAAWYRFAEKHTVSPKLLTLLLAFTPLFWIDSASTMDYVWSLLFIFLAFSAAQQGRAVPAGVWLGIAIGCRPTNGVAVIPVFMVLSLHPGSKKPLVAFMLTFVGTALVAFLPILITYGPVGWIRRTLVETSDVHLSLVQRVQSFLYRSVYSLGPLAALGFVAILLSGRRKLVEFYRQRDPLMVASVAGVLSFAVLFAVFPLDKSYLLPAFPFLFLIAERVASRRMLITVTLCVASFAFINPDVIRHARPVGTPGFNIHPGLVIEELQSRDRVMKDRNTLPGLLIKGKAVVMLATSESFWYENDQVEIDTLEQWKVFDDVFSHSKSNADLHFTSGLSLSAVHALETEGYTVYCVDWARDLLLKWNGYDPLQEGVRLITR